MFLVCWAVINTEKVSLKKIWKPTSAVVDTNLNSFPTFYLLKTAVGPFWGLRCNLPFQNHTDKRKSINKFSGWGWAAFDRKTMWYAHIFDRFLASTAWLILINFVWTDSRVIVCASRKKLLFKTLIYSLIVKQHLNMFFYEFLVYCFKLGKRLLFCFFKSVGSLTFFFLCY